MVAINTCVFVGSHIDDIEAGCAGTLIKHLYSGDEVHLVVTNLSDQRGGAPSLRIAEQYTVLNSLGIKVSFLRCFTQEDPIDVIVNTIDIINPNIIYAPFEFDTHQDHVRAARVGISASRKKSRILLSYHSGSSYNFMPNVFSQIDIDKKEAILNLFVSQVTTSRLHIDIIKKQNAYMGTFISYDNIYAEGFQCNRMEWRV